MSQDNNILFRVQRISKDEPEAGPDNHVWYFDRIEDADDYIDRNSSPDNPYEYVQDEIEDSVEFRKSLLV